MIFKEITNNTKFYDNFECEGEIIFQVIEEPNINIHIWEGYIEELFKDIEPYNWNGLTKDFQECTGPFNHNNGNISIINIDEYYNDIKEYLNKDFSKDYLEEKK